MKIKHFLLLLLLLTAVEAYAQRKAYDSKYIKVGVLTNEINWFSNTSNTIRLLGSVSNNYVYGEMNEAQCISAAAAMTTDGIGKEVLDRLLQRDAYGLHMDRLYEDALNNTTVEEVNEAELDMSAETKDVLKKEISRQLMKNNYIVLLNREGKKLYWSVYKVGIDDRIIDQAFNTWRDPARYDEIKVPVTFVARGDVKDNSLSESTLSEKLDIDMGRKVSAFAMRGSVYSRRPFYARIGSKQGVERGDLLYIYRPHQDDKGRLFSKKICTVRATEVYPDSTRLYTISGKFASRKLGDVAVYKGHHLWAFSLMGQASFGGDPRYGTRLMWERRGKRFSTAGFVDYLLLTLDFNTFKKDPKGVWWNEKGEDQQPFLMSAAFNIGYGKGFNFFGRIEVMPYIMLGCQYSALSNWKMIYYDEDKKEFGYITPPKFDESTGTSESSGYGGNFFVTGHAGVKLNINLWYPLQLTAGADYNYCYNYDKTYEVAYKHHEMNRVNLYAGFRVNL